MITVEYVLALAGTVALAAAIGGVIGPPLSEYRTALQTETQEAQELILQLETYCPAPGGV